MSHSFLCELEANDWGLSIGMIAPHSTKRFENILGIGKTIEMKELVRIRPLCCWGLIVVGRLNLISTTEVGVDVVVP